MVAWSQAQLRSLDSTTIEAYHHALGAFAFSVPRGTSGSRASGIRHLRSWP